MFDLIGGRTRTPLIKSQLLWYCTSGGDPTVFAHLTRILRLAGIKLWGSFGARRSKPLAAGGLSRVNALCVISRAREAEPSAVGNLASAAERGAAFFSWGSVGRGAGGERGGGGRRRQR